MKCCDTCYSICEPLISCFETLLVYLPIGYADDVIGVRITNGQKYSGFHSGIEVIAGTHVEIPLQDFPESFFSAYGGPYEIVFYEQGGSKLTFVAIDGKTYNCITFQVVNGSTDETVAFVNAFYNEIPGGY